MCFIFPNLKVCYKGQFKNNKFDGIDMVIGYNKIKITDINIFRSARLELLIINNSV